MTEAIAQSPRDIQRRAMLLVDHEIHVCVSSLVSTLAEADGATAGHTLPRGGTRMVITDLTEQAVELAAPVLDYESAAREAGWFHYVGLEYRSILNAATKARADSWQRLCEAQDIEPHESEVYEHWAVSEWLGERLTARGERVDMDFSGLHVWARTATGQAIAMDDVIQRVTSETGYASGA